MAQPNSEQYREETARPIEKVGSSASAVGQGLTGEKDVDLSGVGEQREPTSSRDGYGDGDGRYRERPNLPNQGRGEDRNPSDDEEDSRYGKSVRASDSPGTVEQSGGISSYGTVNPNGRPSEAGFDSSGPGGYPDKGDYNLGSFGDASSKQSGIYGRGGSFDESTSEVRNGVRHGVTEEGVASGAGVTDEFGGSTPTSTDIEQHQYHRTELAPSQQKDTPYCQTFTEPDGPSEGNRDRFLAEDDVTGNNNGGTAVDHQMEATEGADHPESEGRLKALMHKLPGHGHKHDMTDSTSDAKEVGSDSLLEEQDEKRGVITKLKDKLPGHGHKHDVTNSTSDVKEVGSDSLVDEQEDPGVITKMKDKLLPNHDKHHDEIDPEFW